MDMTSACMKPGATPRSRPMSSSAGATIVDEKGEMKVKQDTRIVVVHFFCQVQFMGFAGSAGPSHDTTVGCGGRSSVYSGGVSVIIFSASSFMVLLLLPCVVSSM